jgi:hypothetical protein
MPGGLGPRFAVEAAFLIVLAAVAAYARLDATEIVAVMAGGWLLASIFEVLAARRERLYLGANWKPGVETGAETGQDQEMQEQPEEERLSWSRRPDEAAPAAAEAAAVSEAAPQPPSAPKVDDEATGEIARPKRRGWFRRGGPEPEPELSEEDVAARPSARHVRLIRESTSADDVEQRKDAEAGS